MRLQLALNVKDIDQAVAYYSKLFDSKPHKRRPGYANFAIGSPPLKLVLIENRDAKERLNHVGVEVFDAKQVETATQRLREAGILDRVENQSLCCHAVQDKAWSQEPEGLQWEWYRIVDDAPEGEQPDAASCCTEEATSQQTTTCCS